LLQPKQVTELKLGMDIVLGLWLEWIWTRAGMGLVLFLELGLNLSLDWICICIVTRVQAKIGRGSESSYRFRFAVDAGTVYGSWAAASLELGLRLEFWLLLWFRVGKELYMLLWALGCVWPRHAVGHRLYMELKLELEIHMVFDLELQQQMDLQLGLGAVVAGGQALVLFWGCGWRKIWK